MKQFFILVLDILQEIGRARAAQQLRRSNWDY